MVVKPIWEMLKKRFIGSKHFNKALTLEQYYTGTLYRPPNRANSGSHIQAVKCLESGGLGRLSSSGG